ncbi:MAG: polysaccharide biosynthesis protein [Deltaproteobacteria bacterium HGW-Deltaproteobacteria-21]|nr:MAG: polysaccharide biosynthesis protein [Deltaproteobacteria bacterium HGW-Deltaproteobacteria-21]
MKAPTCRFINFICLVLLCCIVSIPATGYGQWTQTKPSNTSQGSTTAPSQTRQPTYPDTYGSQYQTPTPPAQNGPTPYGQQPLQQGPLGQQPPGTQTTPVPYGQQWPAPGAQLPKIPAFGAFQKDFNLLSPEERAKAFVALSQEQKAEVLRQATDEQRLAIFAGLGKTDKQWIIPYLDYETKLALFRVVEYDDKLLIFTALSEQEKAFWRANFPGLDLFLPGLAEPPVQQLGKPMEPFTQPPDLSEIEKIMSGQFPTDISRELIQFGYDFFKPGLSTFTPLNNVPVGPEYILGPGDTFTIQLWGKVEATHNVSVSKDGTITLPRVGALNVSGRSMEQCASLLLKKFREYYTDFQMDISMGSLRTVDLFVVGEAKTPGTYNVSSLSTVITALYKAGGPSKKGSLRKISLLRNGKTISELDLYDFLIGGKKTGDVRVQAGDTIHIPVLGPVVGVAGLVKRPAIYEMKGSQTIGDVIQLAGGVLSVGHIQNVVVERVQDHERRIIKSFSLAPSVATTNKDLGLNLEDGDVVKVYPVHEKIRQVVYLEGHVKYPREYELKPGMKLRDIIRSYEELLPEPYLHHAEIVRLMPPDLHAEIIQFDLEALLKGEESQNLPLQEMDRVIVYDLWEKKDRPEVVIKGAVRAPGTYRLYSGMTVKDLIFRAGNLTGRAYKEAASLTRILPGEKTTDTVRIAFSPGSAIAGARTDNLVLQKDDVIDIREIPQYTQALERRVFLEGEFVFPGEYSFKEGERLISVVQRAGGLTQEAYAFGAVFQRESVKVVQDEQLQKYVSKLEEDILTLSSQSAETAIDKDRAAIIAESLTAKKELLTKLKTSRSTGRMVINLEEAMVLASSQYNFELRPGDRLVVQKKPGSVNVLGEVYNPTALVFEKGQTVDHSLDMVGGATDTAEKGQIYVVRANGAVISKTQEKFFGMATWDSKSSRWTMGGFGSMELDPGDTIIVPKKVEKYPWLRIVKDVTQTLFQIAVSAGVLVRL